MFPKPQRWQSKKYRDAAKGQNCTMRLPGCTNDVETVVLAHRPGSGMGTKHSDWDAADLCMYCHDRLDGRDGTPSEQYVAALGFEDARLKTIINRIERGVLK